MGTIASQITSLTIVYSTVYSGADQRQHQSSVSLAFVWGIHRDRWIPRTKGQLRGKCFHLMTSSCYIYFFTSTLLPTWMKFNPSMDISHAQLIVDEITYPFRNFNDCTVEVRELIKNITPHLMMDLLTFPWWMLVKLVPDGNFYAHKTVVFSINGMSIEIWI